MHPIPIAVLGATGAVGQRFIALLADHPWFRITRLFASPKSAGRTYAGACNWLQPGPIPARIAALIVEAVPTEILDCPIAFSALDAAVAGPIETALAQSGTHIFSNAASHRMAKDVPLVVAEINAEHLAMRQATPGQIACNPNCSTIGLSLALAPLASAFGLTRVHLVSLQATSGAGLQNGAPLNIDDNVLPHIAGEEDKLASEPRKILGRLTDGLDIDQADFEISATCTRVPVADGHTLCVSVQLKRPVTAEQIKQAWQGFRARAQDLGLPSAPVQPIHVLEQQDAPQPKLHRDLENGMAISTGRLRPETIFGEGESAMRRGWKFITLSHNLVRGAAGGSILIAELAVATRQIPGLSPPS